MKSPVRDAILFSIAFEKRKLSKDALRNRSAFGYMEPKPDIKDFAQCESCRKWLKERERCYWLGKDFKVDDDDSCILYVQGDPITDPNVDPTGALTPQEVGFYDGEVRCENCVSSEVDERKGNICALYKKLNQMFPEIFNLKINIISHACCNAFAPKEPEE